MLEELVRTSREKRNHQQGQSTAWKIRIDNEDLLFLKRVSQAIARRERGLIPEPSITALIQTAIKKYVSEALQCYEVSITERETA